MPDEQEKKTITVQWFEVYAPNGELIAVTKYAEDANTFILMVTFGQGRVVVKSREVKRK